MGVYEGIAFTDYVYGLCINWHLGTSLGHRGQRLVMQGVVVLMVSIDWCLWDNPQALSLSPARRQAPEEKEFVSQRASETMLVTLKPELQRGSQIVTDCFSRVSGK